MIKRLLKIALFLATFNTVEHFCHKETDGFSIGRIQFQDEPLSKTVEEVPSPLHQSFRYLDAGNQCFVFLSDDGNFVLKFFKYVHHTPPAWTADIPLLNQLKPFRPHRMSKVKAKRARDFNAYRVAYDQFKSESGLIALHLEPTTHLPTITLYDKLSIEHHLDLNTTPFVLQRCATPVYTQFATWIKNDEIEQLKHGVQQLIDLCSLRIEKKITDDDVHFYSNFGFVGTTPIQVDPGHFIAAQSVDLKTELSLITQELKEWFAAHYPPLVPYVEDCTAVH